VGEEWRLRRSELSGGCSDEAVGETFDGRTRDVQHPVFATSSLLFLYYLQLLVALAFPPPVKLGRESLPTAPQPPEQGSCMTIDGGIMGYPNREILLRIWAVRELLHHYPT
jgi:hypothetical protein